MMQNPIVSIIMPAFDAEKYIDESIESILQQSFKEFELIVIDDGSTDHTSQNIQKYANKDKRIVFLKNNGNLGISKTRNKGIEISRGKYIAWQDADDISMPDRIEKQKTFLDDHPEVGIVGGYLQFFNFMKNLSVRKYKAADEGIRKNIFKYSPVSQGAAMIRKECFDKTGIYDATLESAEDLDMSFRIGNIYKFANLQEIILRYRVYDGSATFKKLSILEKNTVNIRKKYSRGYSYKMDHADKLYNALQYISIYIIPAKIKIYLFDLFRNSK